MLDSLDVVANYGSVAEVDPQFLGRRLVGAPTDKSKEILGAQHRAYETVISTACNEGAITTDGEVVRCSCREPPEYVDTHLVDE